MIPISSLVRSSTTDFTQRLFPVGRAPPRRRHRWLGADAWRDLWRAPDPEEPRGNDPRGEGPRREERRPPPVRGTGRGTGDRDIPVRSVLQVPSAVLSVQVRLLERGDGPLVMRRWRFFWPYWRIKALAIVPGL